MSATVTLTTALQSLCLFPPEDAGTGKTLADESKEEADQLATQLQTCARINGQPTRISSKLVFDNEGLCDDAPYVIVGPAHTFVGQSPCKHSESALCSPLLHVQPVSNPFKSMKRPLPSAPLAPKPSWTGESPDLCVHCKQGNFLEFCFAKDRCRCTCHAECPCKPCADIRRGRPSLKSLKDLTCDRYNRPLATAPISRCMEESP
ncbi:hypothetical protein IWW55_005382 [Coemansia sp. RSA 2706]|nr:hypothetical protein IWW55_005382 [Coemansia sp. RSA 2706]